MLEHTEADKLLQQQPQELASLSDWLDACLVADGMFWTTIVLKGSVKIPSFQLDHFISAVGLGSVKAAEKWLF